MGSLSYSPVASTGSGSSRGTRSRGEGRSMLGPWAMPFVLLVATGLGCQRGGAPIAAADIPAVPVEPPDRERSHGIRGLHGPGGCDAIRQHRPPGYRLPGADAVQGRCLRQQGRPSLRNRSAPLPGPVRPGPEPGLPVSGPARSGGIHPGPLQGAQEGHARRRQRSGHRSVSGGRHRGQGTRQRQSEEHGSI